MMDIFVLKNLLLDKIIRAHSKVNIYFIDWLTNIVVNDIIYFFLKKYMVYTAISLF